MQINRFRTPITPRNADELRDHLQFRDDEGFSCFWLWHENGREMGVMFNGRQAYVHFFPGDGSAGGFALPAVSPDNPDESVEFLADNGESTPVQRRTVVDASIAEEAIVLFYESGERLSSVAWEEL